MTWVDFVLGFLCSLPFFCIGFVAGMLHMRANYLDVIDSLMRKTEISNNRTLRFAERQIRDNRYLGYFVGYREGSRK